MNRLTINVKASSEPEKRIAQHLSAVNGILQLTGLEFDVVKEFVLLNPQVAGTTEDRITVANRLNLKNVKVLNSIISKLRKKEILIPRTQRAGTFTYHPCIYTGLDPVEIRINFSI